MEAKAWEIVIGIETHVQLATKSKIFSNASTAFGAPPNTQASVVDLALPGTLPVMNKQAVEFAIKFGLAVNDGQTHNIARRSIFARKNYFYPDLPKGYQISQFELPVVTGGFVDIQVGEGEKATTKRINLTRAHLEEDAGKSLHEGLETSGVSGIDLNRAGTPLLEIVSEPEMRSAAEAVAYAKALHGIVTWIGICDGNMQEGSFRCDANVSVRRPGEPLGTRCEIKNLNSFRFMERAINYEVRRQIEVIEDGGTVVQQTRLYDADRDETRAMRSKEDAMDYRYFPDPDLLPLAISEEEISKIKSEMIEPPGSIRTRYIQQYGVPPNLAYALTSSPAISNYYQGVLLGSLKNLEPLSTADFRLCATWVVNEVAAKMNQENALSYQFAVSDDTLGRILLRLREGIINAQTAKSLFYEFWDAGRAEGNNLQGGHPQAVDAIIEARGLKQVTDSGAIEKIIDDVLAKNEKSVAEFKSGKDKAIQALIGQVMKASQGKANPAQVNDLLRKKLAGA